MRRNGGGNQLVSLPVLDKLFDVGHALRMRLVVGDRKVDERLAKHSAQAGSRCLLCNRIFEVVHVAVGRRATADHFRESESRARTDEFLSDVFCFSGKDVFRQPVLQIEIVGESAKQRHRNMRVSVD